MIKEVRIPDEEENKTCLAACDTQLYHILMTNANYPTNATFEYTKEFCYVVKKLLNSFENRRRVLGKSQPKLIELLDILNEVSIITKKCTLCCISLGRCCLGLEIRVIIKISTHSCYPINDD